MTAAQQAGGLGRLRVRVLDGLGLVQYHVIAVKLAQEHDVLAQGTVGRDDQIGIGHRRSRRPALGADVGAHAQLGHEARGLLLPVPDQRFRHHDERRPRLLAAARRQHGQHLDGLAEAHVVGQAAAEAEAAQEGHPAETLFLVRAQLAPESRGLVFCGDAVEAGQLGAGPREHLVHPTVGVGLGRQ